MILRRLDSVVKRISKLERSAGSTKVQNKVTRMENMKDVEHVSLKGTNIDCIGILGGEENGRGIGNV